VETGKWKIAQNLSPEPDAGDLALSPIGFRLAAIRDARLIALWDLSEPARPPLTFELPSPPRRIVFSRDGRYLASDADDGFVRVWKAETARLAWPPLRGKLGRPVRRIHFLHAASRPATSIREVAGTYQAIYATGEREQVKLINPEDLPPCSAAFYQVASQATTTFARSPLSRTTAWAGTNADLEQRNETLFLTRTTWELPENLREKIVEGLELWAGEAEGVPLVFAITVE